MKVILIGSSGFIGQQILSECLARPDITSVISLSHRELPISHPKLTTILHSDFSSYPESVMAKLEDADACIYALGTVAPSDPERNRRINMDFTLAAARGFAASLAKSPGVGHQGKRAFRFVYMSGMYTEKDQERRLWIVAENRKMRGQVELELMHLDEECQLHGNSGFNVYIARPGFVLSKTSWLNTSVFDSLLTSIRVDQVAQTVTSIAVQGSDQQIWENRELRKGKIC